MICSGPGPAGTTRECHRSEGEEGNEGEECGTPPHHPFIPRRRKQGCYNLFSWLSMKVRGRATRASVRLDLLPLTPTVYLLSAVSPLPSFSLPICPSPFPALHPSLYFSPQSHFIITHAFSLLAVYHFLHLLLLLFRFSPLMCSCPYSILACQLQGS